MHTRIRRSALHLGTFFLFLLTMLPTSAAATQSTTSTYTSDSFGYTVTWTDDWEMNAEFSLQQVSMIDLVTLFSADGSSFVMITGFDALLIDPQSMIDPGDTDAVIEQDLDGEVMYTLIQDDQALQRTEVYTLNNGETGLMVMVWGPEVGFDRLITLVQDTVLVDGKMIMTGQNLEESVTDLTGEQGTPEATTRVTRTKRGSHNTGTTEVDSETNSESTGVTRTSRNAGTEETPAAPEPTAAIEETPTPTDVVAAQIETYTGTVFGYTVEFDTALWTEDGVFESDDLDGIRLYGEASTLTIWAWNGYGSDARACLQGEADFYASQVDAIANWQTATNANGEPLWSESDDLSWGVFTLTYEGTELVDYISCQPIPGQDAMLITLLSSLPEGYNDALDAALDITEAVQFADVSAQEPASSTSVTTTRTSRSSSAGSTGTRADISTAIDGTTYVSDNYGFSVEIPLEWTVMEEDPTPGDERLVLDNGTSIVTIWAFEANVGDLEGCVDYAAQQSGLDLDVDTDADGKEFRGVYGSQAFGNFVYDDAGTRMMYFVGCEPIPGTDAYLVVIQDVPYDQFTTQRRYRSQLENSIVFP